MDQLNANKAVVLSSGGLDSTTALAKTVAALGKDHVLALSFFYGQRHDKELISSQKVADYYGVKHITLNLEGVMQFSNASLLSHSTQSIEETSYADQVAASENGKVATYVPYRNGLFLSAAASMAMSLCEDPKDRALVVIGNHADDYAGNAYADCSPEFIEAIKKSIELGTYGQVSVYSPFRFSSKKDIVKEGLALKVPYQLTWSCYQGGDQPCHLCGTCRDREEAFAANGVVDPLNAD